MTAVEKLEQREKDLKSMLEVADSLEERKDLRSQLREVRKQLFEGPIIATTNQNANDSFVNFENEKNKISEINNNNITTKEIDSDKIARKKSEEKDDSNMSITISRNSTNFDNNNNNSSVKKGLSGGNETNENDASEQTTVAKNRMGLDRAERRARRAAHMKALARESSVDVIVNGVIKEETKPTPVEEKVNNSKRNSSTVQSVTIKSSFSEETKKEKPFTSVSISKSDEQKNSLSSRTSAPVSNFQAASPSGLRRTATWSTNRTPAYKTGANALNKGKKFGAQAGPSPFSFGTSYIKKAEEKTDTPVQQQRFSFNKYTPTKSPSPMKNDLFVKNEPPVKQTFSTMNQRATKYSESEAVISHAAERSSVNKFNNSEIFEPKMESNVGTTQENAKSEIGGSVSKFSPGNNTSHEEQTRTSPIQQRVGSVNKYNQGLSTTKFSVSGLRRAASMKVTPTYENSMSRQRFDRTSQASPSWTKERSQNARPQSGYDRSISSPTYGRSSSAQKPENTIPPRQYEQVSSVGVRATSSASFHKSETSPSRLNSVSSVHGTRNSSAERYQYDSSATSSTDRFASITQPTTNQMASTNVESKSLQTSHRIERSVSTFATNRLSTGSNFQRSTSLRASPRSSPRSSPSMQRRNEPTEPAVDAPDLQKQSVSDRMAFFRQAQEQEKKSIEKKKAQEEQRKRLSSAPTEEPKKEEENKEPEKKEEKKEEKEEEKEDQSSEKTKFAAPCMKKREKKKVVRRTMSIGSIVLEWVQEMIKDYNVEVRNFSASWNDGMAFCALIHKFNPDAFDFSELKPENKRYNFDLAFNTGMKVKNIPILLDTEDMVKLTKPEPRSVQTYIQWIWSVYGPTSGYGPTPKEVQA